METYSCFQSVKLSNICLDLFYLPCPHSLHAYLHSRQASLHANPHSKDNYLAVILKYSQEICYIEGTCDHCEY